MMRRTGATLLLLVLALVLLGLLMLASASTVRAEVFRLNPYYFVTRQMIWLALGAPLAMCVARFDYHWYQRAGVLWLLALLTLVGLIAVFVPGIGVERHGSARWIGFYAFRVQPSEFAKLAVVVLFAAWLNRSGRRVADFWIGFVLPMGGLGIVLLLIMLEPDFGTTLLLAFVCMGVMMVAGVRLRYLIGAGMVGLAGFVALVLRNPVRLVRVTAFLHPDENPEAAYQLLQSRAALIGGGLFGVGLGNSMQKYLYLPEAHTDFILAIIGEEFGFVGSGFVVLAFTGILICGMRIAMKAPDTFGKLLAFGLTLMLTLQAMINIGVVTGSLPTKGLALPFVSYGGSSLVTSLITIGILINILRHIEMADEHIHTRLIKNSVQRI